MVVPFDVSHEVFDLVLFRLVYHELVGLLHVNIELLGQIRMGQQGVVDLHEAVVIVLSFLILAEGLTQFLVGLSVLGLQFFKPFLGLLHSYLFHAHFVGN